MTHSFTSLPRLSARRFLCSLCPMLSRGSCSAYSSPCVEKESERLLTLTPCNLFYYCISMPGKNGFRFNLIGQKGAESFQNSQRVKISKAKSITDYFRQEPMDSCFLCSFENCSEPFALKETNYKYDQIKFRVRKD